MSAEPTIHRRFASKSRIFAACERLGDDVSVRNIRVEIGGGSYRDIRKRLQEWREAQDHAAAATPATQPPTDTAAAIVVEARIEEGLARIERRIADSQQDQAQRLIQLRTHSTSEIRTLRSELTEIVAGLRKVQSAPAPSSAVTALDRSAAAPRELNAAMESILRRLDELEQVWVSQHAPAAAVSASVDQLAAQMGALAAQMQRMNQWLESRETAAASERSEGVQLLALGQEALAETIGYMHAKSLDLLASALDQLDRRAAARTGRLRELVRTPPARSAKTQPKKKAKAKAKTQLAPRRRARG